MVGGLRYDPRVVCFCVRRHEPDRPNRRHPTRLGQAVPTRRRPPIPILLGQPIPILLAALVAVLVSAGSTVRAAEPVSRAPAPEHVAGLSRLARTEGERLILSLAGGNVDYIVGVNVGPTVPGTQPGELAIPREVWRRWIAAIADAGFHAIRIYTVQPPHFYQELRAHNLARPDEALYLVHGVWLDQTRFRAASDLFDPSVREHMRQDIVDAIAVVHGNAVLPERPGYASGRYDADVSPWLLSWAIGVEMDPALTAASDRRNAGRPPYEGAYFSSVPGSTPTETWLAEMLDLTATHEAQRGVTVPLTFTNWPTTDPLDHPSEPLPSEDLVGIDANHVVTHASWPGGYYASYHAYPYYPDFQRYEPGVADFEHAGRTDPYAGYLTRLREHHRGMPVVVLETGVPSSLGSAHHGPLGRDQGGHDERTQLAIDGEILELLHELGIAGGFLFEWADEWFKFTWNTIDYELPPGRRQLWQNPLTNEAHFGLLAIEDARPVPVVDGDPTTGSGDALAWDGVLTQTIHEGRGAIREVRAAHDASYVYLRVTLDAPEAWRVAPLVIGFDVVPGGNGSLPGLADAFGVGADADTAVVVSADGTHAYVRASNDPNDILYGRVRGYYPVDRAALALDSGVWNAQRLITNRPYVVPTTGEPRPAEWFDLNPLPQGVTDPAHPAFDSRALWAASGVTVELRVPHMVVGFSDPSSLQAWRIADDGAIHTETVERVGLSVAWGSAQTVVANAITTSYGWDPWNRVQWRERPKAGFEALRDVVRRLAEPRPRAR